MKIEINRIIRLKYVFVGVLLLRLLGFSQANAQVSYDRAGVTYTEDFNNGLPAEAATEITWADNSIFDGWYVYQINDVDVPSGTPLNYRRTSNGRGSNLYHWRNHGSSIDGAVGTRPNTASGDMMSGLRLKNETGHVLNEFTLSYTGEQWSKSSTQINNKLVVSYQIGTITNLDSGNWTIIPDLTFNSVNESGGASEALDGSLSINQVVFAPITISSITWGDGEDLWIRWFDNNSSGYDQGLGIDDISFVAIPESSYYAISLGLGMLMLTICLRRHK